MSSNKNLHLVMFHLAHKGQKSQTLKLDIKSYSICKKMDFKFPHLAQ